MFRTVNICVTLLIVISIKSCFGDDTDGPIVTLLDGQIRGHVLESPNEKTVYYAYQDIPYAAPPVGKLRFQAPVAPEKWSDVLNTTHNTHSCFLNGEVDEIAPDVTEGEDCLYINVYTPVKPGTDHDPIPVLFWVHGGGYYFGDGTYQVYGPQYLIDYGVVIVTFNYRLGAFGFLTTEDGVIPGNIGLKDQNFALKWVHNNIALFGGDPDKVTIVGESAGGSSVGYHVVSKKSEGLFGGAILQSGTAICSFGLQGYAKYYAFKMGQLLDSNFTSENSTELLELLQSVPAEDINEITIDIPEDKVMGLDNNLVFVPVIEESSFEEAFIVTPMYEDIATGNINKVPIMIGYNSEEDIGFVGDGISFNKLAKEMDEDVLNVVKSKYGTNKENNAKTGQALRELYVGTKDTFQNNFPALIRFKTDMNFATPIIKHAELQSQYTDVYLYQFSYKGLMGRGNVTIEGIEGVEHAEDLKYLWHIDRLDDGSVFPPADYVTRSRLLKLWTNFVKYWNPTPEADPVLENIVWPKVNGTDISYLNINKTLEVETGPRVYKQFSEIVDKYASHPLSTY